MKLFSSINYGTFLRLLVVAISITLLPNLIYSQFFTPRFTHFNDELVLCASIDMYGDQKAESIHASHTDLVVAEEMNGRFISRSILDKFGDNPPPIFQLRKKDKYLFQDMNNDGEVDVLITDDTSNLFLYLQDLAGNFHKSEIAQQQSRITSFAVHDLNEDDLPDIITLDITNRKLQFYLNMAGSEFQLVYTHNTSNQDKKFIVAEFNGDNMVDIGILRQGGSINELLFFSFDHYENTLINQHKEERVLFSNFLMVDFDQDKDLDFICYTNGSTFNDYENTGDFEFDVSSVTIDKSIRSPYWERIGADNKYKLIITDGEALHIYNRKEPDKYLKDQLFPFEVNTNLFNLGSIIPVDYDSDGDLDVISNQLLFINQDNWTQSDIHYIYLPNQSEIVADYDSDGDYDIISFFYGHMSISEQVTPYTFHYSNYKVKDDNNNYSNLVALQYDEDPELEFLQYGVNSTFIYLLDKINEDSFERKITIPLSEKNATEMTPADLDHDGDIDILITRDGLSNNIEWYENIDGENFTNHVLFNSSWWCEDSQVVDFDGDNDLDIIASIYRRVNLHNYGQIWFYENDGNGVFTEKLLASVKDKSFDEIYCYDLEDDGDLDILANTRFTGNDNSTIFVQENSDSFLEVPVNYSGKILGHLRLESQDHEVIIHHQGEKVGWSVLDEFLIPESNYIDQELNSIRRADIIDFDGDGDLDIHIKADIKEGINTIGNYLLFENISPVDVPKVTIEVFVDQNGNAVLDEGDDPFGHHTIKSLPSNILYDRIQSTTVLSDFPGEYSFQLLNYNDALWTINNGPDIRTITTEGIEEYEIYFSLLPKLDTLSLDVDLTATGARCNTTTRHYFTIRNTGTQNIDSVDLYLNFNSAINFELAFPQPLDQSPGQVHFRLLNIKPNGQHLFYCDLGMPGFEYFGQLFTTEIEVASSQTGVIAKDSVSYWHRCAIDPNKVEVHPFYGDKGYLLNNSQVLEYTVHFQNTGNSYAKNVLLQLELPPQLNKENFQFISSSHPDLLTTELEIDRELLEFKFEDIFLPDSTSDFAGSQGFVKYRIQTNSGLAVGETIPQRAAIYFDLNPAVITNQVQNMITNCSSLNNIEIETDTFGSGIHYTLNLENPILDSIFWASSSGGTSDSAGFSLEVLDGQIQSVSLTAFDPLCSIDTSLTFGTSSISNYEEQRNSFAVYPSLASTSLGIDPGFYQGLPPESFYRIIGINGEIFQSGSLIHPEIDIETLPAGIYFLLIHTGSSHFTSKFVRQND